MNKNILILKILYFFLGFSGSVIGYAVRRDFQQYGMSISDMSVYLFYVSFIWQVKFIPAYFVDRFGFNGCHRRPYILLGMFLASLFGYLLTIPNLDLPQFLIFLIFMEVFVVIACLNYDSLVIEMGRGEEDDKRGNLQASGWMVRAIGGAVGDFTGPLFRQAVSSDLCYAMCATGYFLSFCAAYFLDDRQRSAQNMLSRSSSLKKGEYDFENEQGHAVELDEYGRPKGGQEVVVHDKKIPFTFCFQFRLILKVICNPLLLSIMAFVIFSALVPSPGLGFFYYEVEVLKLTDGMFALLGGVSALGRIGVVSLFTKIKNVNLRDVYLIVTFLKVLVQFIPMGVTNLVPYEPATMPGQNLTLITTETLTNGSWVGGGTYVTWAEANGMNNLFFCLSDEVLGDALDELTYMPFLTVVQVVCLNTVEAAAYETVLSALNLSAQLRRFIDAGVMAALGITTTSFMNISVLIWICIILDAFTLPFVFIVPSKRTSEISKDFRESQESLEEKAEKIEQVLKQDFEEEKV